MLSVKRKIISLPDAAGLHGHESAEGDYGYHDSEWPRITSVDSTLNKCTSHCLIKWINERKKTEQYKKSELMLMRCARAYSSSTLQTVISMVYLHPFHCNSPFCSRKSQKNYENPYFCSSRLFKVIDIETIENHVISACYDKQHVSVYLQPFSQQTSQ